MTDEDLMARIKVCCRQSIFQDWQFNPDVQHKQVDPDDFTKKSVIKRRFCQRYYGSG